MAGVQSGYRNRLFRAVHAEALKRHLDHDAVHDMVRESYGVESMGKLTDSQLLAVYRGWTGHGLKRKVPLPARGEVGSTALGMATAEDLEMLAAEAAQRGLPQDGLQNFVRRQLRGRSVLRTRQDVVRVTTGLRAMNRRDGLA